VGTSTSLTRPFGLWTASAFVIGGMIGAGIFVLPGQLAPFGWTGLAAWGVAIPGVLILAAVVSHMVAARPEATGVAAIIGDALGPFAAVLIGWTYWVSILSANAVLAQTAIRYLSIFEPRLAASDAALAGWSIALIWLLTLLNLRGAKTAGRFQVLTTLLKLVPLIAVLLIGAQLVASDTPRAAAIASFDPLTLTAAITLAFYALVGFESAGVAAERVRDPGRTVARATMLGVALTGGLYLLVCAVIMLAFPAGELAKSAAPIALFAGRYWGEWASYAVAAFAVISATGCLNGWVLMQGEHPLGMARAGLLPSALAVTSARDVPVRLLLLGSVFSSVLLGSSVTSDGGLLAFMLNLTAAAALWFYAGCCLAALRLGGAPVLALAGLGFCGWALAGAGSATLLSLALMTAALPLYWWARRSRDSKVATPASI
jgi:basic amino acid/polyamine antiporter, APA family